LSKSVFCKSLVTRDIVALPFCNAYPLAGILDCGWCSAHENKPLSVCTCWHAAKWNIKCRWEMLSAPHWWDSFWHWQCHDVE